MSSKACSVLLLVVIACVGVHALYSHSDDVIQLDGSDFHSKVIMSSDLWLVEFYAPWCGHCKSLAPEWKKAATALKGIVNIAAVDADAHQQVGGQYGVRGFPTIKVFGADKFKPQDYQGQRTSQGIIDAAFKELRSLVNQRVSGGGSSGGGGSKSSGGGSSGGGSGKAGDPADVVELTDSNFDDLVINSNDMWLVEFFAPWCGHCKNLVPHWAKAATELKGKVKLGALDATVHSATAQRFKVSGYPTIKYFPAGAKDGSAEEYDGGRTDRDIISWAEEKAADSVPAPDVVELTESSVLTAACEDHQLCVISILPHILDCQSACRNDYLKMLKDLGEKYKKKVWGWVWAEAGAQLQLEDALGIGGFGYPAMATVNSRKMKYALLRGPFSETGINEFLRELSFGRGSTAPVKNAQLPVIDAVEAWDGKDGQFPEEEEIDLSDVELDDLDDGKTEL